MTNYYAHNLVPKYVYQDYEVIEMTLENDPIDAALESLRQSDSSNRDSFYSELEDRLMESTNNRKSGRCVRLAALAAVIVATTGVAGVAAVKAWQSYCGPYYIDEGGVVTDSQSNVVGQSVQNSEGMFETSIDIEGGQQRIVVEHETPLNGNAFSFEIGERVDDKSSDGRPQEK